MRLMHSRPLDVDAPTAFAFLADAANNPRWQNGMRSCTWLTDDPIAVGSRYRQEAVFMRRPIRSVFEVVELEPGTRIVITTIESTFPITVERRVTPTDDARCTVQATIDGGPRVPGILVPLVQRVAQRSVDADYERLSSALSGGA